jgi:hypothetical protein
VTQAACIKFEDALIMIGLEADPTLDELLNYAKLFSGLLPEDELCIKSIAPVIAPHLNVVINSFCAQLSNIPQAAKFLEGRFDTLKPILLNWLNLLFTQNIDVEFVKMMYKVGDTHTKTRVPIEFMVGAMTLITNELINLFFILFADNPEQCRRAIKAINAVTGFSLNLMIYSFHALTVNHKVV